jgi:hypothetical protein
MSLDVRLMRPVGAGSSAMMRRGGCGDGESRAAVHEESSRCWDAERTRTGGRERK